MGPFFTISRTLETTWPSRQEPGTQLAT